MVVSCLYVRTAELSRQASTVDPSTLWCRVQWSRDESLDSGPASVEDRAECRAVSARWQRPG